MYIIEIRQIGGPQKSLDNSFKKILLSRSMLRRFFDIGWHNFIFSSYEIVDNPLHFQKS